jgi:hypothetical protein
MKMDDQYLLLKNNPCFRPWYNLAQPWILLKRLVHGQNPAGTVGGKHGDFHQEKEMS